MEPLMKMTLDDLKATSLKDLEAIYRELPVGRPPTVGSYDGVVLKRLNNDGANRRFTLVTQWALFELAPFGVNFEAGRGDWYFFHPRIATAEFVMADARSRWRDTNCIRLSYQGSRLPALVRDALYDEVKPVSGDLILGLGGTNEDVDLGDHFFFALKRKNNG